MSWPVGRRDHRLRVTCLLYHSYKELGVTCLGSNPGSSCYYLYPLEILVGSMWRTGLLRGSGEEKA